MRRFSNNPSAIAAIIPSASAILLFVLVQTFWRARAEQPSAESLYLDKCSVCHGADGAGKTAKGKKLKVKDASSPEVQKLSDEEMIKIVTKGKGADMDGYEKELSKEQIKELVTYFRGLAKKK